MLEVFNSLQNISIKKLMEIYDNDIHDDTIAVDMHHTPKPTDICIENDFYEYLRTDFFTKKNRFYCIWVEDSEYRAALRIEEYEDGYLLHALQTHPAHRRQGYGELLVSATLQYLADSGSCTVYSHVYRNNQPSFQLHKKCGFKVKSDFARFLDGTVTSKAITLIYNS